MKCDKCDQEATVHETLKVSGKLVERHLCERCAREKGIAAQPQISVPELLQKYLQHAAEVAKPVAGALAAPGGAGKATSCPTCGTGYLEFRQTGLLGCLHCYTAFESQLSPLLERAHEGGSHHIGKLPRRALSGAKAAPPGAARNLESLVGGASQRASKVATLRKQLDEAVRAEQYERAARIRDELRKMQELEGRASATGESGGAHTPHSG